MTENISPEERLFNVIQGGKRSSPGPEDPVEKKTGGWAAMLRRIMPPSKPVGQPGKKVFDWTKIIPASVKLPELEAGAINKILIAVLAVSVILLMPSLLRKQKDVMKIAENVSKIQLSSLSGMKNVEPLKELGYYLGEVRNRDIFHPAPKAAAPVTVREASDSLKKAVEGMKLTGISWGGTPKAMILLGADKDGKMYFVTQGQEIGSTGVKVKEILKNKILVSDGTEDMELL